MKIKSLLLIYDIFIYSQLSFFVALLSLVIIYMCVWVCIVVILLFTYQVSAKLETFIWIDANQNHASSNLLVLHTTTKAALVCKLQSSREYIEIHREREREITGAKMREREFYKSSEECDVVERTFHWKLSTWVPLEVLGLIFYLVITLSNHTSLSKCKVKGLWTFSQLRHLCKRCI